jgi:uncharacterized membrane protein
VGTEKRVFGPKETETSEAAMKTAKILMVALMTVWAACSAARAAGEPATPARETTIAGRLLGGDITVRDDYAIVVDGATVTPDVPPVEKGGMIFVPLRFVAEALRADVTWYKKDRTAKIVFPGGRTLNMTIGNPVVEAGGMEKVLPVAPFIFEDRTMVPLRPTAESGMFRVVESSKGMFLTSERKVEGVAGPGVEAVSPGKDKDNPLAPIIEKAHKDPVTKKLKPFVIAAWIAVGLLWLARTIFGALRGKPEGWKDMAVILFFITAVMYLATHLMLSTWWVGIVILTTSAIGLISTEPYIDKLVTMASTAQGAGLICTLFGLGLLIGPAIALHDIAAIGYGIYVKIEPTITGLSLSIFLNMIYSYEARRQHD